MLGPKVMAVSNITRETVVNMQGERLGDIQDLAIDMERGCIAYVVLSFGGFLGMGDKYFAVPWSALSLDREKKHFVLNVDKEVLKDAPGFDKDHWPDMANQRWATQVHDFYGVDPYWT
jgi:sporulation protein YlmC with PRC-barrel domain